MPISARLFLFSQKESLLISHIMFDLWLRNETTSVHELTNLRLLECTNFEPNEGTGVANFRGMP